MNIGAKHLFRHIRVAVTIPSLLKNYKKPVRLSECKLLHIPLLQKILGCFHNLSDYLCYKVSGR